jgi:hypothetical protein
MPLQYWPSLQTDAVGPVHGAPITHPETVHTMPPPQFIELNWWSHESVASMQTSSEHARPSLQFTGMPGWQPSVALHVSTPSQYAPLLQSAETGMWTQLSDVVSQLSIVQPNASAQLGGGPATQPMPARHCSTPSQKVPFEHAASFAECTHPPTASEQLSPVHAIPSLQTSGVPA